MKDIALLDANILTLLIVGSIAREEIIKHRRLNRFMTSHFDYMIDYLKLFNEIMVTPNNGGNVQSFQTFKQSALAKITTSFPAMERKLI